MSTTITAFHNALYAKVAAILSDHTELHEAVEIEENESKLMKKGFAIQFGPGERQSVGNLCLMQLRRSVVITNTIQIFGRDTDKTTRKTAEKALYENQFLLIKGIENDNTLSDVLTDVRYLADNGIESIYGEENENFIMLRSTFTFQYDESFN